MGVGRSSPTPHRRGRSRAGWVTSRMTGSAIASFSLAGGRAGRTEIWRTRGSLTARNGARRPELRRLAEPLAENLHRAAEVDLERLGGDAEYRGGFGLPQSVEADELDGFATACRELLHFSLDTF